MSARPGTQVAWQPAPRAALCRYINESPVLQSLLYDLALLPEQVAEDTLADARMRVVVSHFQMAVEGRLPALEPAAVGAALRARAKRARTEAAGLVPAAQGPVLGNAMLDEQAADAIDVARAQIALLGKRLAHSEALRASAESAALQTRSEMSVLRAVTGAGFSQW